MKYKPGDVISSTLSNGLWLVLSKDNLFCIRGNDGSYKDILSVPIFWEDPKDKNIFLVTNIFRSKNKHRINFYRKKKKK